VLTKRRLTQPTDACRLGCSIKASQSTYAVSEVLQIQLPRAKPLMLVLLIVLPLTYPVMLGLSIWILRWRQLIKARRDQIGESALPLLVLLLLLLRKWSSAYPSTSRGGPES
jgi:hypothetical protein